MYLKQNFITTRLPTRHGDFELHVRVNDSSGKETVLLTLGDLYGPPPLVRLHSECLTGDVLQSIRCDCGSQLQAAMSMIAAEQRGAIVYLRQEGRGIGLINKMRAYVLQDQGLDTVEANLNLGFSADERDYRAAAMLLKSLELTNVRLMTNNPKKVHALLRAGISVTERIPMRFGSNPHNLRYLTTKSEKLGHFL